MIFTTSAGGDSVEIAFPRRLASTSSEIHRFFFSNIQEITAIADYQYAMTLKELNFRAGDGFQVSLLWSPESGQLAVVVVDEALGEEFAMEVEPSEATEVFNHPFAYASKRRLEFRRPLISQAA